MGERIHETLLRVRRRCLVCDAVEEVDEPMQTDPIGRPCDVCHAPTERIEILRRRSRLRTRNPHAAALGHLGGLKGGRARAKALSREERHAIAVKAARARWHKL
jgi:hypothetical protein